MSPAACVDVTVPVHCTNMCVCVCVCVVCVDAVGDADGTLRLSRGSSDGVNEGTLEVVFNGR